MEQEVPASRAAERKPEQAVAAPAQGGFESQAVDEEQVQSLFRAGPEGAAGPQAFFGTGFAYRHDWGNRNGQWILNLSWGAITTESKVFVAIGEGAAGSGKFIGGARYTLHNVAPQNGVVSIWVNIEWSYPIRLYVDYFVVNP
jgi:hypothetical protein